MSHIGLSEVQIEYLSQIIHLEQRAKLIAILVREGIVETKDDVAGFWRGEEWVSLYDLLGEANG
jgi:hypothetical protein